MKNNENFKLDFYREIIIAYENILMEIDYLVEGSLILSDSADDPRKIKIDRHLLTLKTKMDTIIKESTNRYYLEKEVLASFKEMKHQYVCDSCGSMIDNRVGIMKWNDDDGPNSPEEWALMEKFNNYMEVPVRWLTYCINPDCGKIWKEGEFENKIVIPKDKIIKDKIRNEIVNNGGFKK